MKLRYEAAVKRDCDKSEVLLEYKLPRGVFRGVIVSILQPDGVEMDIS